MFGGPSGCQRRNEHDLVRDLRAEYLGYENNPNLVHGATAAPDAILSYLPGRAIRAFDL